MFDPGSLLASMRASGSSAEPQYGLHGAGSPAPPSAAPPAGIATPHSWSASPNVAAVSASPSPYFRESRVGYKPPQVLSVGDDIPHVQARAALFQRMPRQQVKRCSPPQLCIGAAAQLSASAHPYPCACFLLLFWLRSAFVPARHCARPFASHSPPLHLSQPPPQPLLSHLSPPPLSHSPRQLSPSQSRSACKCSR
jgi:hypothetical protein